MEAQWLARDCLTSACRLMAVVAAPKSPWPTKSVADAGMNLDGVIINQFQQDAFPSRTAFKVWGLKCMSISIPAPARTLASSSRSM